MLVLLLSLLATATLADGSQHAHASPGSSLSGNNPITQVVMLCTALFSARVGAQFTNGEESSDDFEQTIVTNVQLDDDDNDFEGNDINEKFGTAPQGFIQFEPRTYASIVAAAVVITLLGLWAAFDFQGGRLTPARLAAIRARAASNGGFTPYLLMLSAGALSALLLLLQLAFLVIATIYVVQPMLQWAVVENPNGTQSVIAQDGLFAVSSTPGAPTLTIVPVAVVRTNFPPFFFPLTGIAVPAPPTGAVPFVSATGELVLSPTPISVENTWYVWIVFVMLLAQFFVAMGMALVWRGGQYIAGSTAVAVGWALNIALLVFIALELSDLNPGQAKGEEIAVLVYAIAAVVLLVPILSIVSAIANLLRAGEFAAILGMNDEELASITPSTDKRRQQ